MCISTGTSVKQHNAGLYHSTHSVLHFFVTQTSMFCENPSHELLDKRVFEAHFEYSDTFYVTDTVQSEHSLPAEASGSPPYSLRESHPKSATLTFSNKNMNELISQLWVTNRGDLDLTEQWSFPPVSIPNLNVVIPTQAAFVQIHGGEVENDLGERMETFRAFNTDICVSETMGSRGEVVCSACTFSPGVTDILQTQCVYDGYPLGYPGEEKLPVESWSVSPHAAAPHPHTNIHICVQLHVCGEPWCFAEFFQLRTDADDCHITEEKTAIASITTENVRLKRKSLTSAAKVVYNYWYDPHSNKLRAHNCFEIIFWIWKKTNRL